MNLPNTPLTESESGPAKSRFALVLARRLLVTLGGLLAFGVLSLLLAGTANAETRDVPPAPPANSLLAPIGGLLSPVTGALDTVTAPVTSAATAALAPAVDPITRTVAPVTRPLLQPAATAISPALGAVEPLVGPLAGPALTAPEVATVTAQLGGGPATAALVGPSTDGTTAGGTGPTPDPLAVLASRSTTGARHATAGGQRAPTLTLASASPPSYGDEAMATDPADWSGSPGAPVDPLADAPARTTSAGPGGASGTGQALPVGRWRVPRAGTRWAVPSNSWPALQNWREYDRNHPS